jgi:hypothetical protein
MLVKSISEGRKVKEGHRLGLILMASDDSDSQKVGSRMSACGLEMRAQKLTLSDETVIPKIAFWHCYKRGCPNCDRIRAFKNIDRIISRFKKADMDQIKFVTATYSQKVHVDTLREHFDKLSKGLTKLFGKKAFSFIDGGFKALEAVVDDDGFCNPHCHMLIEHKGKDLRKDKNVLKFLASDVCQNQIYEYLKNRGFYCETSYQDFMKDVFMFLKMGLLHQVIWSAYFKSVGLGSICDVRSVDQSSAWEVSKYFTKTWVIKNDEHVVALFKAIKGKRLVTYFGSFKDIKSEDESEGESVKEVTVVKREDLGPLSAVICDGLATGDSFKMLFYTMSKELGLTDIELLDVPILDSKGWRELPDDKKREVLQL